eukprot:1381980-Pyramimonas_sp.AAC.1
MAPPSRGGAAAMHISDAKGGSGPSRDLGLDAGGLLVCIPHDQHAPQSARPRGVGLLFLCDLPPPPLLEAIHGTLYKIKRKYTLPTFMFSCGEPLMCTMWDSAWRAGCMSVVTTSAPSIANAIPATPSPAPSSKHLRDAQGSSSSEDALVGASACRRPPVEIGDSERGRGCQDVVVNIEIAVTCGCAIS